MTKKGSPLHEGDNMTSNSNNKLRKLEETLVKFKRVEVGEYKYSELCSILEEDELEHGSKKRKTQLKHWKQYMNIEYIPKTDTWIVKEIYEEKLLEKISSSQYYERMCYILYLYLYQKYEREKSFGVDNDVSVPISLSGTELYKLFGLVNDMYGIKYDYARNTNEKRPTDAYYMFIQRMPTMYQQFLETVSSFSKTILNNCLQSLRDKRLINYYIKYEACTALGELIVLTEEQTNLLTKIERKALDDVYDDLSCHQEMKKSKQQFGMQDIYFYGKMDSFKDKVCFYWESESEEKGAGFPIKWYRCIYYINAIQGYFERYINTVIKNDVKYAEYYLQKYQSEINDISFQKLDTIKKKECLNRFMSTIDAVEKNKDKKSYVSSRNIKLYNELFTQYYFFNTNRLIEKPKDEENQKFNNKGDAVKAYLIAYDKMLNTMVKRPKNT